MTEQHTETSAASNVSEKFASALASVDKLRQKINGELVGQLEVVDQVLIALLSNGHVLLEGVPGLGKTLLVRVLANCFDGDFKRIQFTPDLMPADVTGHVIYDASEGKFRMRKGPVFTNILLADEVNRAPAKTQAALLEVMQERQVTLEGVARPLPKPFMVLATQNPIEQEGTYPLPEAELDRFLMKVVIDYPNQDDEIALTKQITTGHVNDQDVFAQGSALFNADDIFQFQQLVSEITLDDKVLDYAVRLVRATRTTTSLIRGAGTRACIALVRCARAKAFLRGSDFVLPSDVKSMAFPVLRHRVGLSAEMEIDGFDVDQVLSQILNMVEAPRL
ncbi:AAA family ATPase [Teredinibacter waterburyi]|jgi:MoxR-like ATPases|uniref:AAA family ATPase n=1 Tax=Teredinibacter waterburyi TaxID=1500538 RepID=UPI00165F7D32|nr:MoxR family ATPase [Teredinibacter waterburyi]